MQRMQVTYRVASDTASIEARAQAIAVEQSIEMPPSAVREARIRDEVIGRVDDIRADGDAHFRVTLGLASETTGFEAGQLMNMVFGNSSLHSDLTLVDLRLPPDMPTRFGGPHFGVAGLRAAVQAPRRALTCTALKPQGSSSATLARLAGVFARAGIDVIKDDHGIADQRAAPFHERVPAIQTAINTANAEHGTRTLYAPTLNGGPRRMQAQLETARAAGVRALLVTPMLSGFGLLQELASEGEFILIAHPALAGPGHIAPELLFGTLFRLFGADAVIYPNYGGRFSLPPARCQAIAEAARRPFDGLPAALPVPAGGMQPERVEEMLAFYGPDVMLLIGGALLEAADPERAARDFVERVANRIPPHDA